MPQLHIYCLLLFCGKFVSFFTYLVTSLLKLHFWSLQNYKCSYTDKSCYIPFALWVSMMRGLLFSFALLEVGALKHVSSSTLSNVGFLTKFHRKLLCSIQSSCNCATLDKWGLIVLYFPKWSCTENVKKIIVRKLLLLVISFTFVLAMV